MKKFIEKLENWVPYVRFHCFLAYLFWEVVYKVHPSGKIFWKKETYKAFSKWNKKMWDKFID